MDMTAMRGPTKLADVLKRSGLAASINDAKRIASDISTTERKVQSYFDQKKGEMQDDLANKSHNAYVEKPIMESSPKTKIIQENIQPVEEIKEELEIEKEPENIQKVNMDKLQEVQDEVRMHLEKNNMMPKFEENNQAPVQDLSAVEKEEEEHVTLYEMFKEENQGQEYIYSKLDEQNQLPNTEQQVINSFKGDETISETIETIDETIETIKEPIEAKMEVLEEEPMKPVQENKMEVLEEKPMKPVQENKISEEIAVEPIPKEKQMDVSEEQKVDLSQMFNFGSNSSNSNQSTPIQETKIEETQDKKGELGITTNDSNDHPKTGNSESIDINEMFNFAKRGKI